MYLFSWDNVPGNDSLRLINFLNNNHNISWAKIDNIAKSADGNSISLSNGISSVFLALNDDETIVKLEIENKTKITDELVVKIENNKLNIYSKPRISLSPIPPSIRYDLARDIEEKIKSENYDAKIVGLNGTDNELHDQSIQVYIEAANLVLTLLVPFISEWLERNRAKEKIGIEFKVKEENGSISIEITSIRGVEVISIKSEVVSNGFESKR